MNIQIHPIAHFQSDFKEKFGIPRQSCLIPEIDGTIIFEPAYRNPDYLRALDGFDYIWLIWGFSANKHEVSGSTVRPPRLGGNRRVGIFATRSPYRPNPIGLSSVKIHKIEQTSSYGNVIHVKGGDLLDGSPIYDIKPYIEFTDSHNNIRNGYVDTIDWNLLEVKFSVFANQKYNNSEKAYITKILEQDPRPHYHDNPEKVYKWSFKNYEVHFIIKDKECIVLE